MNIEICLIHSDRYKMNHLTVSIFKLLKSLDHCTGSKGCIIHELSILSKP